MNSKGKYLGTPTLVLEILSASTRSKDMIEKLNTFMLSGVQEYWIVDPKQKHVMVYHFIDREIETLLVYRQDEKIVSAYFEGLEIEVACLFEELPVSDYVDAD